MFVPHKPYIIDTFRKSLRSRLDATAAITALARDEATSDQTKPENKYDTRALEASYLAAGQGERLGALKKLVIWFENAKSRPQEVIGLGSLIHVEPDKGSPRWLLMAPQGGEHIDVEQTRIELLGVHSPLGRALLGLGEDDGVEIETPRGRREWTVLYLS